MRITLHTVILYTYSIVQLTIAKSLSGAGYLSDLPTKPIISPPLDYINQELEDLKSLMRSRAPSISNIHQLNITLEAKRRLLRQYREKLLELNELDLQSARPIEEIHQRVFHSYIAKTEEAIQKFGTYSFGVDIAQPTDHRKELKVQSATLKLHRQPNVSLHEAELDSLELSKRNVGHNTVLLVYQSLPAGMRRLVTSTVISLARNTPINIDVSEIVQSWLDEPAMNYGIEVECPSLNISNILLPASPAPVGSFSDDYIHVPTLDIYTYESTITTTRRSKRDVQPEEEECIPGKCCRKAVDITLAEIGHHIEGIHEDGAYITAYYCNGRCSRNYKLHNKWSSIKNIIRTNNRDTDLRNRCAPTAYEKSYNLLNFDIETFTLSFTEYDDLIVKQCGCV